MKSYYEHNGIRLARVFPRRTNATPDDAGAFFGPPPFFVECDEVHVDVTFTADKLRAEELAEEWRNIAPVKIGGVAYGDRGDEFIPGKYIKHGYTFTSRGCPERCWYCSVWKRDPSIRLLPIQDGWNVLDDNLLACPQDHFRSVIEMLSRQLPPHRIACEHSYLSAFRKIPSKKQTPVWKRWSISDSLRTPCSGSRKRQVRKSGGQSRNGRNFRDLGHAQQLFTARLRQNV